MKYIVTLNQKKYEVDVTESEAILRTVQPITEAQPPVPSEDQNPAKAATATEKQKPGTPVKSPMPGNILSVKVSTGQQVKAGDVLFVLEAMKMENEIVAPVSGTVKQLLVSKGSVVETDTVLAVL